MFIVPAPPGMSPGQQLVQLGDHPGVIFAQRPAAAGQAPQHRELLVIGDLAQAGHPGSGQGDRVRRRSDLVASRVLRARRRASKGAAVGKSEDNEDGETRGRQSAGAHDSRAQTICAEQRCPQNGNDQTCEDRGEDNESGDRAAASATEIREQAGSGGKACHIGFARRAGQTACYA